MVTPDTRPLVICDAAGSAVDVVRQNGKGHAKSIETGDLWSLHPDTERLLPYPHGAGAFVEDRGTWYKATLAPEPARRAGAGRSRGARDGRVSARDRTAGDADLGDVLTGLAAVIRQRHRELPEGSYTTHLFTSGTSRIRKKVGEEAVELLLAEGPELVSESADFLYHLLVLLEAEGVSLSQIAAELRTR